MLFFNTELSQARPSVPEANELPPTAPAEPPKGTPGGTKPEDDGYLLGQPPFGFYGPFN